MFAWVQLHLPLISSVLAIIVAFDHILAQSDLFKASSSAQAVFNGISSIIGWVQGIIGPKPPPAA